ELGVGKNMVSSIKYWLQAVRLIKAREEGGYESTDLGEKVFSESGYDPYLEDEGTIWFIHWLLCSNPDLATGWFWFFNNLHKQEFSSEEGASSLVDFTAQNIATKVSKVTLRNDAKAVLRMYGRSKNNSKGIVEEALDSPLSSLGLISQSLVGKTFKSQQGERKNLPIYIFGYAVLEYMQALKLNQVPIEELMYSKVWMASPGAVFRLSENSLVTKLEELSRAFPENFELRETAGIHQFYILENIKLEEILDKHYSIEDKAKVA
ncbi:DUF4007 family protein, partial [Candidatus Falkowbacteria bacterium]|nr:DUF4007 family protein [Candidatus Falkowbacteria bacterium]